MAESQTHKRAKAQATGERGQTEKLLNGGRRLRAASAKRATEVGRSGPAKTLQKAAQSLTSSRKTQKVLQVPEKDMGAATVAMRETGVGGTVKNMSGTRRRSVPKRK